jgi:hypothetical protein
MSISKAKSPSISVQQVRNPNVEPLNSQTAEANGTLWEYKVTGARNYLNVSLGDRLTKEQLQKIIHDGVDVAIII